MAQGLGSRSQLLWIEEATYGTTPASTTANTFKIPFVNDGLVQDRNALVSATIRSDRMVPTIVQGNKRPGGTINVELRCDDHARLLKHVLGPMVATSGIGPYTHQIDGQSSLPVGFSIDKGFNDVAQFFLYKGCKINRCTFNFPQEGFISAALDLTAREEVTSGTVLQAAPTEYSDDPLVSYEAALTEANYGSGLAAISICQAAQITIENSIKDDNFVIGDARKATAPEGMRRITGQITVFFEDLVFYNKYVNGTVAQLKIVATKGANSWTWFLPRIFYAGRAPTPVVANDRPIVLTLPFQAVRDATLSTDLRMTIINDVTVIS